MAYITSREHFEELAEQALEKLPEEFKKHFNNIAIIIEDLPTPEETKTLGVSRKSLLGIFRGAGYPHKDNFFEIPPSLPDEIILFQKNIEGICSTEKELIEEIGLTFVHEVGHYFGLSEEELRKYER
jgi:predicted Zn-dependent protease with MMP-like domain